MPVHVLLFARMAVCARAHMLYTSEDTRWARDARGIPMMGSRNMVRDNMFASVQHDVSSNGRVHTKVTVQWAHIGISYCHVHIVSDAK